MSRYDRPAINQGVTRYNTVQVKNCLLWLSIGWAWLPVSGYAQLGIGVGVGDGFPFTLDRKGYYNSTSPGVHASVSYQPRNTDLFPSFTFLFNELQMPVYNGFTDDLNVFATQKCFILNMNLRSRREGNYYLLYGGIGISHILPFADVNVNAGSSDWRLIDSGNVELYPVIDIGVKGMHKLWANYPVYLGVDASLTFIRMHDTNDRYYVAGGNTIKPADVSGDILFPGLQISINYFMMRKE